MKYLFVFLLLVSGFLQAQPPTVSPSLVSNGGNAGVDVGSPAFNVSWSVGEPCITTIGNGITTVTQGFHQPLSKTKLRLDSLLVSNSLCKSANNGWAKVKVKGGSGKYSYEWSPVSSAKDSVGGLPEGGYRVLVTDSVTHDTLSVFVKIELASQEECDLTVYKGFSPNGDGKNDTWIIDGIDLSMFKNNTVNVFNRYGTIVYQADDYDNKTVVWDGQFKGGPLPDGTYYYEIVLLDRLENGRYTGWVELTR